MKYLLLIPVFVALTACEPANDRPAGFALSTDQNSVTRRHDEGCTMDTSSKMVSRQEVGKITNLVKDKQDFGYMGRCIVKFDMTVNGKTYHLEESEEGLEQLESLCYYARERAKKDLLLDLGGEYQSETSLTCTQKESA